MRYVQGAIKKDFNTRITAFEKASVAALNKVNSKVFTQVKRGISKDTGMAQKAIVGVARRITEHLWCMLVNGCYYQQELATCK